MAERLDKRLDSIEAKSLMVVNNYNRLREAKRRSDERVAQLLLQVEEQSREIADLRRQVEYMKVATTLAPDEEALNRSRRVISQIVREIDRCIADLNI